MAKREIVEIDEKKCTGCGQCIPNCHEGALQIIDGKARLISDLYCDGLGACLGHCPEGAMEIIEREAEAYDETKVMSEMVKKGPNTIKAHLLHLKDHQAHDLFQEGVKYLRDNDIDIPEGVIKEHAPGDDLPCGCPGTALQDRTDSSACCDTEEEPSGSRRKSQLKQWPVQLHLIPPHAPFLKNADLVVAADCVPFAYPEFHNDFLKGKVLIIGCPKLDDVKRYAEKLTAIFTQNDIRSVTAVHMEVPCCFGLLSLLQDAIKASGKVVPFAEVTISVKGEVLN